MVENEFLKLRPKLFGLAYRMLGSVADSEDIVQDAWLRYAKTGADEIEFPQAYFRKIVTRLCLDTLKSARHKREQYIGTWLPEPVDARHEIALNAVEDGIDISFAIMLTLEQLSPLERAAYLLHDLFDMEFDEIAKVLERNVATCRKLASRARQHLAAREKRFAPNESSFEGLLQAFLVASKTGDLNPLQNLLADDIKYYADGGGKILVALNVVSGAKSIAKMLTSLAKKNDFFSGNLILPTMMNGQLALVIKYPDGVLQPIAIDLNQNGKITAIYTVRNPDKLLRFGV